MVEAFTKDTHPYNVFYDTIHGNISGRNINIRNTRNTYGDIFLIKSIMLPINCNLSMLENFSIYVYSNIIFEIPFYLLIQLSSIKYTSEYIMICIPQTVYSNVKTFSGFVTYLTYFEMGYKITSKECIEYSVVCKNITIKSSIKHKLINDRDKMKNETINQYIEHKFFNKNNIYDDYYYYLQGNRVGAFIKVRRKLKWLELVVKDHVVQKYDDYLIEMLGSIINAKSWTDKHKKALFKSLNNKLPVDVINIINKYMISYEEYLYWIPFDVDTIYNSESLNGLKGNQLGFRFDSHCNGTIYFVSHSQLNMR